jgi:hypothetical protein
MLFNSFIIGDSAAAPGLPLADSFPLSFIEIIYKGITSDSTKLGNQISCGFY